MTEIPEHLLQRSKAAKAKAAGGEPTAEASAASPAPATTQAVTPAAPKAAAKAAEPSLPAPPPPDPPYVAAAKSRPKIPFWAMATLSILPLWVFMYARGLTPKEPKVTGPLGDGAEIYTGNCSSCHGGKGQGGVGRPFAGGEVLKTFPHIEDQLRFVYNGTLAYGVAGIDVYGNPEREGGAHVTHSFGVMPAQKDNLTESEILAVVCHERYTLGGADPKGAYLDEYEKWCSPEAPAWVGLEDGSLTFSNIADELPETFPVGTVPAPGHAPGDTP